ncbi:uncharacterized protein LOC126305009 [Schistocerca gregaria]|uniref:uncharacterized protein LOC126305009 n=1 Tax=Schistocerca gregaria TaxID=7010 RepID=UPI00211F2A60|nr:uncharacterized protein LOC126305009 [Schistocerca gregaria]
MTTYLFKQSQLTKEQINLLVEQFSQASFQKLAQYLGQINLFFSLEHSLHNSLDSIITSIHPVISKKICEVYPVNFQSELSYQILHYQSFYLRALNLKFCQRLSVLNPQHSVLIDTLTNIDKLVEGDHEVSQVKHADYSTFNQHVAKQYSWCWSGLDMLTYQWLNYFIKKHLRLYLTLISDQKLVNSRSDTLISVLSSISYTILDMFSTFNNEMILRDYYKGKIHLPLFQSCILEELFCAALYVFKSWYDNENKKLHFPSFLNQLSSKLINILSFPYSVSSFHLHWIDYVQNEPGNSSAAFNETDKQGLLEAIFKYPPNEKNVDALDLLHKLLVSEENNFPKAQVRVSETAKHICHSSALESSLDILGDFSKKSFYYLETLVGWSSITPSIPKLVSLLYKSTQRSNYSSTFEHLLSPTRTFFCKLLYFLDQYCRSVACGFEMLDSEVQRLSKNHKEPFPYYRFSEFTRLNNSYVNISALSILCRAIRQYIDILEKLMARNFILHLGICSSALESNRLVEIVLELQQLQLLRIEHLKYESFGGKISGIISTFCSNLPDEQSGSFSVGHRSVFNMIPMSTITSLDKLTLYFVTYLSRIYYTHFSNMIEIYIDNQTNFTQLLTKSSEMCWELLSKLRVHSTFLPILWSESYPIEECFCKIVMALDKASHSDYEHINSDTIKKLFEILLVQEANFDSLQICVDLVFNAPEPSVAIQKLKSKFPVRGTYIQRVQEFIGK